MHPIVAGGLLIGGLCASWIFTTGFTGLYKEPAMTSLFVPIVMTLEIGALIWGLRKTAAKGRSYSGQVVAGTLMAMIGSIIIFAASIIFTTVLYPNSFAEVNEMSREVMRKAGQSEEQIRAAIDAAAPGQTPVMSALFGVIGAMMTGIIASAIIAIWVRARNDHPAAARN
jgi:hypothetical protein